MFRCTSWTNRRSFIRNASMLTTAATLFDKPTLAADSENPFIFGSRAGYSPQLGALVSEMNWMRMVVLMSVKGMSQEQLDFLLDKKANTIGALLLHLAATEKLYQLNTFDNVSGAELEKSAAFKDWVIPMNLGEPARQKIKNHNL
ncbi:MAG TPA: hypothetical protein VHZ55_15025, partial [Bryobacteraceae bacterium]|nr:hypothetical protein [Bryobacteraceae bacterium]